MVQLRTLTAELARLLASIAIPIYVLDDERRIVYANPACATWLGVPIEDLIGQTCAFHSSPIGSPLDAKIAGLCPPPEALAGARMRAAVSRGGGNGQLIHRKAEFIPLFDENENCAGVFAIAALNDMPPGSAASIDADDLAAESNALHERLAQFHDQLRAPWQMDRLVGESPAMARVRSQVRLAWRSRAAAVVIGQQGSGRQHVAKAIHYGQSAAEIGDLVPLSCATLGTELLRSTLSALLGRQKLSADRPAATLLLTDVPELPAEAQAKLAGQIGGDSQLRIVSTAAAPLEQYASRGEFRHDLACALSTIEIQLPPLAERREDLPLLAQMFLEELNAQGDRQLHGFSPEALDQLAAYPWPGNIDELAAMVREAHERAEGNLVGPRDLPQRIFLTAAANRRPRRDPQPIKIEEFLGSIELELIQRALRLCKGNKTKAARLLGLTRPRLYRRMVQLGLEEED
ncbi:MAG TPA: sigma 54-interacting transcriptional regulator [Pirellulales bacterium]|jgi:DNA-binding NtrC family response regulator|nr:sigma 54-interacting transcriptional regulator [Pirellulales bacterium]